MRMQFKHLTFAVALLGMAALTGCSDSDSSPTSAKQNDFPSVQGIQISPNAPVYVDDVVTLSPATVDPNNDEIRYTWSTDAGAFNPEEAVGPSIKWTAPSVAGTYTVVVVGDDGNGGTSQKHLAIKTLGGNQSGTVDVVGGLRANPVGGTSDIGYIDSGDTVTLVWDNASPITTDSTRPDETKYAPDGSRLDPTNNGVVSTPQYGYADGLPARNGARYALIGRVESGEWFEFMPGADADGNGIPDSFSAIAPARGRLFLGMNEQNDLLQDNTGFWRFAFTITHL